VDENETVDDCTDRDDDQGEEGHHGGHHHGAKGHTHGVSADADGRYLTIALLLIVVFMAFEVVVGILAHSLALLSDAAHMLTAQVARP
jgi:cobalt-zinc-cadmium efflux system protein